MRRRPSRGHPLSAPNPSTLWGRVLVEELARCGVQDVCLAPGSRSTPLVLAAHDREGLRVRVFLDERSAAFFALGLGRASGRPAAVITTSGTAVANLLPAVVEASQSEVPLVVVTADRPHELRDADANQAIRQPGIFASYVREAWDLQKPTADDRSLRHLRGVAARAVAGALGAPAGPVHINVPFTKPLEPTPAGGDVQADVADDASLAARGRRGGGEDPDARTSAPPMVHISPARLAATPQELDELARVLASAQRPLVVAGPSPEPARLGEALVRFAAAWGFPLLADPLSGGRTVADRGATRVTHYDLFLRSPEIRRALTPDLVLRVGAGPTSAALLGWLESLRDIPQVVVDGGGRWKDHLAVASRYLRADAAGTLSALLDRAESRPSAEWRASWQDADEAALDGLGGAPGPQHEGDLARMLVQRLPSQASLFVSSSMPVRDVDGFGGSRSDGLLVYGNRGASGIDGIVSTAAGVAAATGRRCVALLGDLAFLHDSNGLLALREPDVDLVLVVVNNDGGGIFHMLPIREFEPAFTPLFATPHGLDLRHLAALHQVPHVRVTGVEAAEPALEEALAAAGSRIVEIRTDREGNRVGHEAAVAAVARAVVDRLNQGGGGGGSP